MTCRKSSQPLQSCCPERVTHVYFGRKQTLQTLPMNLGGTETHQVIKLSLVEWRHLPVFPLAVKNKFILALEGNLTFTRSSLLRRSMTLMMKSLAIWKFCRPMLSELSNTNRRSTGPQVHSVVKHTRGEACVCYLSCSQSNVLCREAYPSNQPVFAVSLGGRAAKHGAKLSGKIAT